MADHLHRVPIHNGHVYFKPQGLLATLPIAFLPDGSNQGDYAVLTSKQVVNILLEILNINFPFFPPGQNTKFNVLPREEGEEKGKYIQVDFVHPQLLAQVSIRIQLPEEIAMSVLRTVELGTEALDTLLQTAIEKQKTKLAKA